LVLTCIVIRLHVPGQIRLKMLREQFRSLRRRRAKETIQALAVYNTSIVIDKAETD